MDFPTRIYLTGFMGSGKSTIGPILANVLGYNFVDLDTAIAASAGKSIKKIFSEEGEDSFRKIESEMLRKTVSHNEVVISLGGGALTVMENLYFALEHGKVVYIRVPVEQLINRLTKGRTVRPLLLDDEGLVLPESELRDRISRMLNQREFYYLKSHIIIEAGNDPVGKSVDAIVEALRRF